MGGKKKKPNRPIKLASAGNYISSDEAEGMVQLHCKLYNSDKEAFFFGRNKLLALLEQDDCQGLRIYFGAYRNSPAQQNLVIAGVDSKGNNIKDKDLYLNRGWPCPPHCPDDDERF